ncbi:MAG: histidine--tRNA ligase [Betaproteobacteria bacterium]|jgi:histidyl-tRNA synthetase|nr:histidine--tRNA ligase [Betaproteobacteria bacterium]
MNKIQAIRGMNDILPEDSYKWEWVEYRIQQWLLSFGYENIRTPVLESTDLFVKSIGVATDIVEKEMYTFTDALNGDSLTLRPEGTASAVRAALEHNMTYSSPRRLYYFGPMFRHERPQKGRYRQFHQVGVEALGFSGPVVDAENVLMASELWKLLELPSEACRLEVNSLGSSDDRVKYREALVGYLKDNENLLDADSCRRLHTNPLRVLDSKNPDTQKIVASAPKLLNFLSAESVANFDRFKSLLQRANIDFKVNPNLVRGLDYYNDVVYEWKTDYLGAQGTICAGGRYDGLAEQIGGKSVPACGFALGIERVLAVLEHCKISIPRQTPDAYVVFADLKTQDYAWDVSTELRQNNLCVVLHGGAGSLKSQMKKADNSGAKFAIILGESEAENKTVSLKRLRDEKNAVDNQQQEHSLSEVIKIMREEASGTV